jgi:hypothetical protein
MLISKRYMSTSPITCGGADFSLDEQKWERERQTRLEYFKKLQDYQVEKENVYVI